MFNHVAGMKRPLSAGDTLDYDIFASKYVLIHAGFLGYTPTGRDIELNLRHQV